MTDRLERLRWYNIIGPWPVRLGPVFFLTWLFGIAVTSGSRFSVLPEMSPSDALEILLPNALTSALLVGILAAARRLFPVFITHLSGYLIIIAASCSAVAVIRLATGIAPQDALPTLTIALVLSPVRLTLMVLVVLAVTGIVTRRLTFEASRADQALLIAREQQVQLLSEDERVRSQIASILHDRVQADLISIGLQLQELTSDLTPEQRAVLRRSIDRLEELRSIDVRRAARALSPSHGDFLDLQSSIEDLAAQYLPSMRAVVSVAPEVDDGLAHASSWARLGAYRIIEQALLNAAVHGRARNCRVQVSLHDGDRLEVLVTDDGRGPSSNPVPGLGTAVITTWTRVLDGQWSLALGEGGGAVLRAELGCTDVQIPWGPRT
jgi:signal transduction histidine kinase